MDIEHLRIVYSYRMQNAIAIQRVGLVTMPIPVGGTQVDLNVSRPFSRTDTQSGIEEIGAGIAIVQTGLQDVQSFAAFRYQWLQTENALRPDVVKESFVHVTDCKASRKNIHSLSINAGNSNAEQTGHLLLQGHSFISCRFGEVLAR